MELECRRRKRPWVGRANRPISERCSVWQCVAEQGIFTECAHLCSPRGYCVDWEQIFPFTVLNKRKNDPNSGAPANLWSTELHQASVALSKIWKQLTFSSVSSEFLSVLSFHSPVLAKSMDEKESLWSREVIRKMSSQPSSHPDWVF